MKHYKFFTLIFLLLFARGCDFYSTSLWFFDNPSHEINPLTSILGFGWTGLVLTNIIIVGLIIYCFYFYTYKYSIEKIETNPIKLTDYISERYFNERGRFYQVFYKTPKNKKVFIAHSGYILVRVMIIASFLATIHNLCQYYNVGIYNSFREIVKGPLYVIYGLILLSLIYFSYKLWSKEYRMTVNNNTIEI